VSHLIALVRRIRYSEIHLLILSIVISAFIFPILLKAKGIVTTNTPGKLYCVKLHQDNHQAWLAVSTDYGETLEAVRDTNGMIRDSVGSIRYNPDLDVMLYSKGYDHYISHDEGVTSEYFHRASPNDWNWNLLPSQDSLIVANQYLQYSCDSLETWTRNRLIGLEGTWNTGSVGKAFGWSSGDYAVLSIFRNIDSTITKFYFSETYCDSFYVTGVLEGDWLSSNHLYPGYEPGEYYMADNGDLVNTIFYCSLDTGRTWTESGNSPINIYTDGGFDVASGWMEGELFLSWGCIDYWVDSTYFGLYHSTDYGETWELVHRMEDSEPENPEDVVERVSKFPSNYSIQAYPNPTNSSITIQLPENTTGKLYMHNNAGRLVLSQQINTGSIRYHIDLTNLPSGSYWLQYKNQTTMNSVKRIILMN
ncbi:MAG: T9SS type A sorting domain-containing protein, partial [Candidatus Electryonea clarkiae]|nr:T9SS type A sorting domain-containing protein [Candidatus Electryonea clarkiae]